MPLLLYHWSLLKEFLISPDPKYLRAPQTTKMVPSSGMARAEISTLSWSRDGFSPQDSKKAKGSFKTCLVAYLHLENVSHLEGGKRKQSLARLKLILNNYLQGLIYLYHHSA